jgi:hypothetical protein
LIGIPKEKRPLGRYRIWKDNIKTGVSRNRVGGCGLGSSGSG